MWMLPNRHRRELGSAISVENRLTHPLVLVVVGQRHQGVLLGHVGLVADTIDARRGGIDEAPHAARPGDGHQRLERVVVDRFAEAGVELEAGIVRDAGQVDDGVDVSQRRPEELLVADVAANLLETRRPLGEDVVAEQVQVKNLDPIAAGEEFRHEHCPDVAGAPGHQDRSNVLRHVPFSISRKIGGRTRKRHHRRKTVARARAMFRTLTAFDCPYERSWWIKPTSTYE